MSSPEEHTLPPGHKIAGYTLVRFLGRGAMGEVYEAVWDVTGEHYALKLLSEEMMERQSAVERFQREAEIMAALDHPCIAKVMDWGLNAGRYWLCIELLGGMVFEDGAPEVNTLEDFIRYRGGKLPQEEVQNCMGQFLDALRYAHGKGLVHRDLKPANILLCEEGMKIADFGLVDAAGSEWMATQVEATVAATMAKGGEATLKMSDTSGRNSPEHAMLGTFAYMSPEQKKGWPATAQSDLYAAGLVCYYMLTGEPSIGMEMPSEIDGSLWPGWDPFIRTALKTNPEQRFEDAGRMYAALNRVDQPVEPSAPDTRSRGGGNADRWKGGRPKYEGGIGPVADNAAKVGRKRHAGTQSRVGGNPEVPAATSRPQGKGVPIAVFSVLIFAVLLCAAGIWMWWNQHQEKIDREVAGTPAPEPNSESAHPSGVTGQTPPSVSSPAIPSAAASRLNRYIPGDAMMVFSVNFGAIAKDSRFKNSTLHEKLLEQMEGDAPEFILSLAKSPERSGLEFDLPVHIFFKSLGLSAAPVDSMLMGGVCAVSDKPAFQAFLEGLKSQIGTDEDFREYRQDGVYLLKPMGEEFILAYDGQVVVFLGTDYAPSEDSTFAREQLNKFLRERCIELFKAQGGFRKAGWSQYLNRSDSMACFLDWDALIEYGMHTGTDIDQEGMAAYMAIPERFRNFNVSAGIRFVKGALLLDAQYHFPDGDPYQGMAGSGVPKALLHPVTGDALGFAAFSVSMPAVVKFVEEVILPISLKELQKDPAFNPADLPSLDQEIPDLGLTFRDLFKVPSGDFVFAITDFDTDEDIPEFIIGAGIGNESAHARLIKVFLTDELVQSLNLLGMGFVRQGDNLFFGSHGNLARVRNGSAGGRLPTSLRSRASRQPVFLHVQLKEVARLIRANASTTDPGIRRILYILGKLDSISYEGGMTRGTLALNLRDPDRHSLQLLMDIIELAMLESSGL